MAGEANLHGALQPPVYIAGIRSLLGWRRAGSAEPEAPRAIQSNCLFRSSI